MIRLWGHKTSRASFGRVMRGMERALRRHHVLGDVALRESGYEHDDVDCDVNLVTGDPSVIRLARATADAEQGEVWLLLAPNSTRIPEQLEVSIKRYCDGVYAPSLWAQNVLRGVFGESLPVRLWQHGFDPDVFPGHVDRGESPGIRALHFSSTMGDRKGTKVLCDAWRRLRLPEGSRLLVVAHPEAAPELSMWCDGYPNINVMPAPFWDDPTYVQVLQHAHVIIQPSRAEGFGLVPLEALASGRPVAMTAATGTADYWHWLIECEHRMPVQLIPSGASAPSDDCYGAEAPAVGADDVHRALVGMQLTIQRLSEAARDQELREMLVREWTWEARAVEPLKELL